MKKVVSYFVMVLLLMSYFQSYRIFANTDNTKVSSCLCGELIATANYENDDELYLTENYATYYFSNLTDNFGKNTHGSCTQIAFTMVLSFYDTYWNDSFIPQVYDEETWVSSNANLLDAESPGILQESSSIANPYMDAATYKSSIMANASTHFHLKMLEIDIGIGHYNDNDDESPCGMLLTDLHNLMEAYMYGQNYMNETEESLPYESDSIIGRAYIIEQIQNGIPVIIRMGRYITDDTMTGHAMVAYDYDEANDEIYVHTGWDDLSHVKLSDLPYTIYWDSTIIDISNIDHVCSDNYVFVDSSGNTTTPCPCQKLAIHPEHEHSLSYAIANSTHIATCSACGFSATNEHNMHYISNGVDIGHTGTCSNCGYTCTEAHTWIKVGTKFRCGRCAALTAAIPTPFASLPPEVRAKLLQMGYVGDFAMDIGDGTVLCRVGDNYYLVRGQTEDTALSYLQNELSVISPDLDAA